MLGKVPSNRFQVRLREFHNLWPFRWCEWFQPQLFEELRWSRCRFPPAQTSSLSNSNLFSSCVDTRASALTLLILSFCWRMLSAAGRLCAFATLKKLLLHDVSDGVSAVRVLHFCKCVRKQNTLLSWMKWSHCDHVHFVKFYHSWPLTSSSEQDVLM